MKFERPKRQRDISPTEKKRLLEEYLRDAAALARDNPTSLNRKIPRERFAQTLDQVGGVMLEEARRLAIEHGPVMEFLDDNPLPESMASLLPPDFRAYCLLLNALKQWVSAEQAATDRYLLGGTARTQVRNASSTCIASGEHFNGRSIELHHPVRDGRPPVPLLKEAHSHLESQVRASDDPLMATIAPIKQDGHRSWILLREGLDYRLALKRKEPPPEARPNARSFATKVVEETRASEERLLEWMDENELAT